MPPKSERRLGGRPDGDGQANNGTQVESSEIATVKAIRMLRNDCDSVAEVLTTPPTGKRAGRMVNPVRQGDKATVDEDRGSETT